MAELWDVLDKNGNQIGRVQERGWLEAGNYHLIVYVWIINGKGEFLISQRTPNKRWPNKWACTAGSAVAGDGSLKTAMKEVNEELGITLNPENGQLYKRYRNDFDNECGEFIDIWFFRQDIEISSVIFQADETCDAMWASERVIRKMADEDIFIPTEEACLCLDDIFAFARKLFKS